VLLLSRVDKPALLRRLFELACRYSGQILSYTKMLGQLQDAGNTTTLAHYLDLQPEREWSADCRSTRVMRHAAALEPKLQVLNTALMTVTAGVSPQEALADHELRGRLIESAVGAHLANAAAGGECELYYWRERGEEVDVVVKAHSRLTAIEVKSGRGPQSHPGTAAFAAAFKTKRTLLVGGDGISVEEFLSRPVSEWLAN
jgi:predicted AAA+ superfamily ATPase